MQPPPEGRGRNKEDHPVFGGENVFSDVTDNLEWAKGAINRMNHRNIITGYGDGIFRPNQPVTHLESIIMIVRVMGLEEEALELESIPDKVIKVKGITWEDGYKYIAIAAEYGIVSEGDLRNLHSSRATSRHEVARYIVKALEMEEEAEDRMGNILDYKDFRAIPEFAVGYVDVISHLGIMEGNPNGTFQPNTPVTRAQMAVLVDRAIDYIDGVEDPDEEEKEDEILEFEGKISSITVSDEPKVTVNCNVKEEEITFNFVDDTEIKIDGESAEFEDISVNDKVKGKFDEDKNLIEIQITRIFHGIVAEIKEDNLIIEKGDGEEKTFEIAEDIEVNLDGEAVEYDDILVGDEVEFKTEDGKIVKIDILVEDIVFEGEVVGFKITEEKEIIIKDAEGEETTYTIYEEDVMVTKDDEEGDFDDLRVGDEIEFKLEDGIVTEINILIEDTYFEIEGTIESITRGEKNYITITIEEDEEKTYEVAEDAKILIDEEEELFKSLSYGYKVEIEGEDKIVILIKAYVPEI